jgi:hypothetical protein
VTLRSSSSLVTLGLLPRKTPQPAVTLNPR